MKRILALLAAAAVAACASPRPKFYPNDHYRMVGDDAAKKDADACLAEAKSYLKSNPMKPIAKKTGVGAAMGAAVGAIVGAITGDFRGALESGAAAGAASGLVGGTADAALNPDDLVRAYTDRCLAEKGYSVLGWR
jgi:outer membrane lipoprotein SlyB